MPRDFAKVRARFWTGETGRQIRGLGLEARVVSSYLMTCASSNMIGLYYLPLALLCHEIGIPLEGACKALRSLESVGFAYYDDANELVFVPRMAAEQIAEHLEPTDKQCAGVARELKAYAKSRFFAPFVYLYREAFHLPEYMGTGSPLEGPCKALRSQEQEQEQEDPSLSGSSSLSASDQSNQRAKGAHDWYEFFRAEWWKAKGRQYGQGSADAKGEGRLHETLESLPPEERAEDWAARERMVGEFLAKDDKRTVEAGWSFSFFASVFNGLRVPPEKRPKPQAPGQPKRGAWPSL